MMGPKFEAATALLAVIICASSSPIEEPIDATNWCIVKSFNQVSTVVSKCSNIVISGITVPAGRTLDLNLKTGATVIFRGTITFEFKEWSGPLIHIRGTRVHVIGYPRSVLDGQGPKYWDGLGDRGLMKAKFFKIETNGGSTFRNIHLLNCPRQCVLIDNSRDTTLSGWNIDVSLGDSKRGRNTDGFDLSGSSRITIEHSVVRNQDDCVAVNQGSHYLFQSLICIGGHGLSLSVGLSPENGQPNTVHNVTFAHCIVQRSRNGIHVKTHTDAGKGSISDVNYRNITMSGIARYGVNVQQDYSQGQSTGRATSNIPITNLNLTHITGSMVGQADSMPVYILCGSDGCRNWKWSDVSIGKGRMRDFCNFSPAGFRC